MPENPKQKVGIESRSNAREPETKQRNQIWVPCQRTQNERMESNLGNKMKGTNPGAMPKNPKQKEGIESGRDAGEPETKRRDQIQARCRRTRNKTKGSNLGEMPENSNQNKGNESSHDTREPETKGRNRISARCRRIRKKWKGSHLGAMPE